TNDAGMASGNLKAIAHPRSGKLSATIGFSARDVHDITVQGASGLIINTPVMVADVAQDGAIEVNDDLGFQYSAEYLSGVDIEVTGQPGEVVNVSLGSVANPVQRRELHFPMNVIFDGKATDVASGFHASVTNVHTVSDSPQFKGRSYEFGASASSESHLILPPETSLTLAAEWRATLAVKPYAQAADGLLMKFRDGVSLFIQADHRLRLEIASGDVVQTLVTQQALNTDQWQYVSVTVEN